MDFKQFEESDPYSAFCVRASKQSIIQLHSTGIDLGCMSLQEEELSEAEKRFKMERGGGNYGVGTKEMQEANYRQRKEQEKKRRELFDEALAKFKQNNIEGVSQRQRIPFSQGAICACRCHCYRNAFYCQGFPWKISAQVFGESNVTFGLVSAWYRMTEAYSEDRGV